MVEKIIAELDEVRNPEKVEILQRFFKTGKGQYAEGDILIGVSVPNQRKIACKFYKEISLKDVMKLLRSNIHEHRLTALLILVLKFEKSTDNERKKIYDLYMGNTKYVNNWDLVDLSAPKIVGAYLIDKDRSILCEFARSDYLWEKRIAMLSTFTFIRVLDFDDALRISEILVGDTHDLIHKAVGWMLREIGNKNQEVEERFLKKYYKTMPRTMLRYAIEKFDEKKRKFYLN